MPTLVSLSFTAILDLMAEGLITDEELASAIFCFGCTKGYIHTNTPDYILKNQQARHQSKKISKAILQKLLKYLEEAEIAGRVIWRRNLLAQETLDALSRAFERAGLAPLNSNLPPDVSNNFLKGAIERVNNKNGMRRVRVITYIY